MTTSDAVAIIDHRYIKGDSEMESMLVEEEANAEIARYIYDLRNEAGLTQEKLAEMTGISAKDINRLEESDYEGHTLAMLRRVAKALGKEVRIEVVEAAAEK